MIGRELVRLGLVRQRAEKFGILEITDEGREVLSGARTVTLTQSIMPPSAMSAPKPPRPGRGEISCDEPLFERLRRLRKQLADQRNVPAYIVFSDVSLRQMARDMPSDEDQFKRISGVGEKKLREFGALFISEIADHRSGVSGE